MRIGLIGATAIAERAVVRPSGRHDDVRVHAVAARDAGRAAAFADRNGIARVHTDYGALIDDPAVDTVYISLHNSAHHPWAVRAARSGRHVIVEKPLCLDPGELADIRRAALAGGARVTEAVPTAGHAWQPAVRAMIRDGRYGRLRSVRTGIRFAVPAPGSYRDRPGLGGGIFLDCAAYWLQAVQASTGLAGATGSGRALLTGPYGADREFEARLDWPDGRSAALHCEVGEGHRAHHEFVFEEARVRLRNFLLPTAGALPLNLVVEHDDGTKKVLSFPPVAYYDCQLDRVRALLRGGAGGGGGGDSDSGGGDAGGAAAGAGAGDEELDLVGERVELMASIHQQAMCAAERQE